MLIIYYFKRKDNNKMIIIISLAFCNVYNIISSPKTLRMHWNCSKRWVSCIVVDVDRRFVLSTVITFSFSPLLLSMMEHC